MDQYCPDLCGSHPQSRQATDSSHQVAVCRLEDTLRQKEAETSTLTHELAEMRERLERAEEGRGQLERYLEELKETLSERQREMETLAQQLHNIQHQTDGIMANTQVSVSPVSSWLTQVSVSSWPTHRSVCHHGQHRSVCHHGQHKSVCHQCHHGQHTGQCVTNVITANTQVSVSPVSSQIHWSVCHHSRHRSVCH